MRRRTSSGWWVAALVLVALGVGAYVLFLRGQPEVSPPAPEVVSPVPVPGTAVAPTSPEPTTTPPESVPGTTLPPLAESDAVVRELAGGLSSDPGLSRWLSEIGRASCRERVALAGRDVA